MTKTTRIALALGLLAGALGCSLDTTGLETGDLSAAPDAGPTGAAGQTGSGNAGAPGSGGTATAPGGGAGAQACWPTVTVAWTLSYLGTSQPITCGAVGAVYIRDNRSGDLFPCPYNGSSGTVVLNEQGGTQIDMWLTDISGKPGTIPVPGVLNASTTATCGGDATVAFAADL